jgi:hypothetical protein
MSRKESWIVTSEDSVTTSPSNGEPQANTCWTWILRAVFIVAWGLGMEVGCRDADDCTAGDAGCPCLQGTCMDGLVCQAGTCVFGEQGECLSEGMSGCDRNEADTGCCAGLACHSVEGTTICTKFCDTQPECSHCCRPLDLGGAICASASQCPAGTCGNPGASCSVHPECCGYPEDELCVSNICRVRCWDDDDCGPGETCRDTTGDVLDRYCGSDDQDGPSGTDGAPCTSRNDCAAGYKCVDFSSVGGDVVCAAECATADDCAHCSGILDDGSCVCAPAEACGGRGEGDCTHCGSACEQEWGDLCGDAQFPSISGCYCQAACVCQCWLAQGGCGESQTFLEECVADETMKASELGRNCSDGP